MDNEMAGVREMRWIQESIQSRLDMKPWILKRSGSSMRLTFRFVQMCPTQFRFEGTDLRAGSTELRE